MRRSKQKGKSLGLWFLLAGSVVVLAGCSSESPGEGATVQAPASPLPSGDQAPSAAPPATPPPAPSADSGAPDATPPPPHVIPKITSVSVTGIIAGKEQIVVQGTFDPAGGNVLVMSCSTIKAPKATALTATTVSESATRIVATLPAPIADITTNTTYSCGSSHVESAGGTVVGPAYGYEVDLSPLHNPLSISTTTFNTTLNGRDSYSVTGSFVSAAATRFVGALSANVVFVVCSLPPSYAIGFSGNATVTSESTSQIDFNIPHQPAGSVCQIYDSAALQGDNVSETVMIVN